MRGIRMKYILMLLIVVTGCTDVERASWSAYGDSGEITCYSGGEIVYQGVSTGRIGTVNNSDGWEFKDSVTGKFVRISGTCVIKN